VWLIVQKYGTVVITIVDAWFDFRAYSSSAECLPGIMDNDMDAVSKLLTQYPTLTFTNDGKVCQ